MKRIMIRTVAIFFCLMAAGPVRGKTLFLAHYNNSNVHADHAIGETTATPVAYSEQHGECGLCNLSHSGYQIPLTTESGRFGRGLDLTDVNHNITYPASKNLDPRKGTAEVWFIIDDHEAGTYHPLLGWFNPPVQPGNQERNSAIYVHTQDTILTLTTFTPDQVVTLGTVDSLSETGTWHHLELNWDCTGGDRHSTYNVYLDGENVVRLTDAGALDAEGGSIHLGIWDSGWGHFLRGRMDELRITDQIEHETSFTPPVKEYATPGTASGVDEAYRQALSDLRSLQVDLDALGKARRLMQSQIDIDPVLQFETGGKSVAEQAGRSLETLAERLKPGNPDQNLVQLQDAINEAVDSLKTTHHDLVKMLGALYTHIPDIYNRTIVDLGYLKDEREGFTRAIRYLQAIPNENFKLESIEKAEQVSRKTAQVLRTTSKAVESICSDFYELLKDSPGDRKDPVAALPGFSVDPVKRGMLENISERLTESSDAVSRARGTIHATLRSIQTDPALTSMFPEYRKYIPAELPPVEVAPDGTLKRVIFGGGHGRTETLLSLGFDTLNEGGSNVEWPATDEFTETETGAVLYQWRNYQVPVTDTVLLYAVGDRMYRPPWFNADEDNDYYLDPDAGSPGSSGLEFRHPEVRKMIRKYLEEHARITGNRPYTFIYKGPWEAHPYRGSSATVPGERTVAFEELGYSRYAIQAFRSYLREKFGSITALNESWRSSYEDFDEIQPPEPNVRAFVVRKDGRGQDVYVQFFPDRRLRATPLTYEFERCRKDDYTDYLADCYRAIKRGDPVHPVASSTSGGIMDEILINSLDDLRMPENCVDMWGKHPSGGIGWTDSPYMWGLNRYFNKTLVCLEYYGWGQEEIGNDFWPTFQLAEGTTSERVYNNARRDVWHDLSWDRRMMLFYWTQKLVEMRHGVTEHRSPLVRQFASFIPVVKRRIAAIHEGLMNVPVLEPRIGVLHSSASNINAYPTDVIQNVAGDIFDRLLARQYHFGVVPESFLVSGRDSLDRYEVLILPYVQYVSDGFYNQLLEWIREGGTVIAAGPFGLFDEYGFDRQGGISKVFPEYRFSYPDPGEFSMSCQWEANHKGKKITEAFLQTAYGRGTVLVTLDGRAFRKAGTLTTGGYVGIEIGGDNIQGKTADSARRESSQSDSLRPLALTPDRELPASLNAMYEILAQATERKAWVTRGNVEMVLRGEDSKGGFFASMLNWNYREPLETEVVVRGEYRDVTDLCIPGGFPVPATVESGMTTFPINLGPGEGLMLRLQ
jgi:hypothetical protein